MAHCVNCCITLIYRIMVNADTGEKDELDMRLTLLKTSSSAKLLGASSSPKGLVSGDLSRYCFRA